jgi:hypothetical protein
VPCVARAFVLAVASICLALNVHRLDATLYTLVRDLPWAGIVAWVACMALAVTRRASTARLRVANGTTAPWLSSRAAWGVMLTLAAAAVVAPRMFAHAERGLSLRVTDGWRGAAVAGSPRLVSPLAFDETSGPPWTERPLTVALDGWVYAPVGGEYHFELTAGGDALLELDGVPHLGLGDHGATLRTNWATDPATGARRAARRLETGFHRLTVIHRHRVGPTRLRVRWVPPYITRYRSIPKDFLLAGETSAPTRRGRALALGGRRAGTLVMALVLALPLGGVLARARDRLAPRTTAPAAAGP